MDHMEITLPNGSIVKIDKQDKWILDVFPSWQYTRGYCTVRRWIETEYGNVCQQLYLHKVIVWPNGKKWQVDHANRDKLDNRRCNLRMATPSQNGANTVRATRSNSGYRGVHKEKRSLVKPYRAIIAGNTIGRFPAAEDAARAYDKTAKEMYGDFAVLNFP